MVFCNEYQGILQRETSDFLEGTFSATNNERILQRVRSYFLQLAISAMSNERIWQRVTSNFLQRATSAMGTEWFFCNEPLLQRVTSKFCNEQRLILQRVTSNEWISMSNEQWVKSYASINGGTQFLPIDLLLR